MIKTAEKTFSFAEFEINAAKRQLTRNGLPVALNPKAFDLLALLVAGSGRVLSKNEILETVWENQFVEENNLTVHISALRKILGERKGEHRFIVTVPGKGYKFVADVRNLADEEKEITIESHTISRVLIEEFDEKPETDDFRDESRRITENSQTKSRLFFEPKILYPIIAFLLAAIVSGFWFFRSANNFNGGDLKFTKLTTSGKITNATLAPDGKYAVFSQTENDGESLWLRHIATGSQTRVLPPKPVRFVGLTVTPDGNSIYCTTFSANIADPQIWRVPLLGGAIEEITGITTGAAVSFSPAGDKIAFTESRSSIKETQLLTADANGANKRILIRAIDDERAFPNFAANPVAWSPGGGEIACAIEQKNDVGVRKAGILLVDSDDGKEKFISPQRWDYIEHLAWIDEDNLAFVAYTTEPWQGQIWTISRNTGEAKQITKDLNSYSWLASAQGNLLSVQKNSVSHISTGDFDEKADSINARDIFAESGFIDNVAFTAAGDSILYSSSANGKREIWRINPDGANPVQLTVNSNATFGLSVSPIDNSIVFGSTENGRHLLKIADADGKNLRNLTEGIDDLYPNFTADGQTIIFQRGLNNKLITLWRLSLADKNPVQLTRTHATHPAVSRDGRQTAYYFMDAETDGLWRIGLISNEQGAFVGKLSFPKFVTERRMRWHPGGKFIGQILYRGENINFVFLPTDGSESKIVSGLGKGDVNWFDWSPDGSQIAVSRTTQTQDIIFLSK